MEALFFWLFSGGMIVCALAVVLNRNAVASALCFTFTIVCMAGLFVMLSAFFLAAVQILVTAGAVMVLFLFIIMLLDLDKMEHMPRPQLWMGASVVIALGFLFVVASTLGKMPQGSATIDSLNPILTRSRDRSQVRRRAARTIRKPPSPTIPTRSAGSFFPPMSVPTSPPTSRRLKSPACSSSWRRWV